MAASFQSNPADTYSGTQTAAGGQNKKPCTKTGLYEECQCRRYGGVCVPAGPAYVPAAYAAFISSYCGATSYCHVWLPAMLAVLHTRPLSFSGVPMCSGIGSCTTISMLSNANVTNALPPKTLSSSSSFRRSLSPSKRNVTGGRTDTLVVKRQEYCSSEGCCGVAPLKLGSDN